MGKDSSDSTQRKDVIRKLTTATILCSCFLVVEVAGGLWSGSLAVLSDAAHLFADLASFAVAIAASHLASLPATKKHTYGLKRTESLAALFSVTSLAVVSLGLAYHAIDRLVRFQNQNETNGTTIDGRLMTGIAGIGLVVNIALAFVLGEDHVHLPGGSSCDHGHDHGEGCHGHDKKHDHGKSCHGHHDGHDHGKGCHGQDNHGGHDHGQGEGCHGHDEGHDHGNEHRDEEDHDAHRHQSHHGNSCSSRSHEGHSHDHSEKDHSHDGDHHHGGKHHDHEVKNESSPLLVPNGSHDHDSDRSNHREQQRNVNLHAAYLHVMGDLAQSLAVFLGGLVIWWKPEWQIIDPILTLGFSSLVLWSITGVMKNSLSVLLEETPANINWQDVYDKISAVPNVHDVHDLHIWCISHGQAALSVHCTSSDKHAIGTINKACRKFGIQHTTIQVNWGSCGTCPTDHRSSSGKSICDQLVQ